MRHTLKREQHFHSREWQKGVPRGPHGMAEAGERRWPHEAEGTWPPWELQAQPQTVAGFQIQGITVREAPETTPSKSKRRSHVMVFVPPLHAPDTRPHLPEVSLDPRLSQEAVGVRAGAVRLLPTRAGPPAPLSLPTSAARPSRRSCPPTDDRQQPPPRLLWDRSRWTLASALTPNHCDRHRRPPASHPGHEGSWSSRHSLPSEDHVRI